jgi:predicted nucleotide-binding protein
LAPYPTDTDAHTAFVRTVMLLGAFLCAAVYVGVCVSGRIRAGRRQDKSRMRLFLLGGNAAFATTSTAPAARTRDTVTGQPRAFVVHGRDEAALHEVACFVDRLGIEPVVLRELPSGGRTIIEKFEDLSEVDCAVVLLTPDDRGGLATDSFELQRPRARQNVLLELGFFLGRLGRGRVCVLYRPSVEIPSDYGGVLFVELDDKGAWKLPLAGELREAGLEIDLDQVFGAKASS